MKRFFEKTWRDALCIAIFLVASFAYFASPLSQGLVLGGHDTVAAVGQGQETINYRLRHDGETPRWTNAIFSGMPTYQMSPSYGPTAALQKVQNIYALGTGSWLEYGSYLFLYLLGFYILLRAFGVPTLAAGWGAGFWALSSYFLIIIAAGHIWKVLTLACIPPTIAGLVLCYRGRLLWGGVCTALFTALQVLNNHLQMTYYFLFPMFFLVAAYGVAALRRREAAKWARSTAVAALAGLTGVLVNLPNLYHTYEYTKHSLRGPSELTSTDTNKNTGGLDRDYITAWSYGIGETLTLLVPDFKGRGSSSILEQEGVESLDDYQTFYGCAASANQALQQAGQSSAGLPGLNAYWGDQPFTVGPVYAGAIVCLLFFMGLYYVRGPVKWALLAATLLALLMAWGRNLMPMTDFFIDHLPLYAKFRTVSSALVVVEFTLPLLAVLCLTKLVREPELLLRRPAGLVFGAIVAGGTCLVLWLAPQTAGNALSAEEARTFEQMTQAFGADFTNTYAAAVSGMHRQLISASAGRSLLLVALALGALLLYSKRRLPAWALVSVIGVATTADLWNVDKRYLNDSSFTDPQVLADVEPWAADNAIRRDTTYYRVLSLAQGNPFNETSNRTAYFHHSIGGYHAAKMHRYQDLIDRYLSAETARFASAVGALAAQSDSLDMASLPLDSLTPCLNMLNAKYVIFRPDVYVENPRANGAGWFVDRLTFAPDADAEMKALGTLDTKREAVADERFRAALDGSALDSGSVRLTFYEPNEQVYSVTSRKGGVVVLSEIYYPGWTATVDGKPAETGRVNYVLRAVRIPAGHHTLRMTFRPASVARTEAAGYAALALILAGLLAALGLQWRAKRRKGDNKPTSN